MAHDLYIDGRILVSGAKGWLGLGNPISLTRSIQNVIIPNIPVLAALPYIFQNGLTATGSGPTVVSLGGTLLNNTIIDGTGFDFEMIANEIINTANIITNTTVDYITNSDTITNTVTGTITNTANEITNTVVGLITSTAEAISDTTLDYKIDTASYFLQSTIDLFIGNSAFNTGCGLDMKIQSELTMDTYLGGTLSTLIDGSKYVIEGSTGGNLYLASGFYNYIEDCIPKSVMEQSILDTDLSITGYSSVRTDGEVTLERFRDNSISAISTKINLEGAVVIEAVNQTTSEFNRIITSTTTGIAIEGDDIVTGTYGYELPNTTPNNGDIMIADGAGKLLYKPLEQHVQAIAKIGGAVGQKAFFHLPFIENHVCTRINFVSENTLANDITIEIKDEHNAGVLDIVTLIVSNTVSYWGGYTTLTVPLASTDVNRLWSAEITANSATPVISLYLTLTFVPEIV
jgi:hypothetical protein